MMASDYRSRAAVSLLSRMLFGISETALLQKPVTAEPDFALDEIETIGTAISTKVVMPSGDVFRVVVAWDEEESP
jgi:hypothetical protein